MGLLNRATLPLPFALPGDPASPASVVTVAPEVIFRIVWLYLRRGRDDPHRAQLARPGGRHAGRRATGRRRVRRRVAAGRLDAARPPPPARRRGDAASLDERRGARSE